MRKFQNLSVRRKLTLIIMVTSATALLVACLAFVLYDVVTFRESMVRNMIEDAELIGANSTAALSFSDPAAAREVLSAMRAEQHVKAACIYSADGRIFAQYTRPGKGSASIPLRAEKGGSRFERERLILFHPVLLEGETIGTVYLQSDLGEMHDRLWRFAGIVGLVVLASRFLAYFLSFPL